jgi:putative transposase
VAKPRRVQQDGIRFQGFRYLDLTLAAYVGEAVTIRYDPRDLAEIRVYYQNAFLCRAVCQELADLTISLKEIIQARTTRRRQLRAGLASRASVVELLLPESAPKTAPVPPPSPPPAAPVLKRYFTD